MVYANANIGPHVHIGAHAVVGEGVVIGEGTRIGAHVTLQKTTIGQHCILHPGVRIGQDGFGFAVGPAVPASMTSVPQFLEWAKANPQGANYGSPAAGSTPHFIGALLGKNAGVELKHAAYRGTQPAMLDLLGGNISAVSGPIGDITQHLSTGKVRILGVSGTKRSRFAPNVPTFEEQGAKGASHSEWFAFLLPPKANADVVARMNAAVFVALKPGGLYVILDHQAAPGAGTSVVGTLHRIEGTALRAQVEVAGFIFDGETEVVRNPEDDHSLSVFDEAIRGRTDQFVYRFRKPG